MIKGTFFIAVPLAVMLTAQQPTADRAPAAAQAHRPGTYAGVASCINSGCHGSTQPLQATRVLQNEYFTWLNRDPHSQAYNVLFNAKSARIARNMRLRRSAYQETLCLDCHSTNVPANAVSGRIDLEDGVQCEACHGPAGGWRSEHAQSGWTHQQSVARGAIDLRNVQTRARVCLACHQGNERAEVDHELIAAGHPILPFELDNYTATMPPHWHQDKATHGASKATHGASAWAIGQLAAFRQSLENLARHARGPEWPEFSDMSCHNCHHSLEGSEWRQERGWPDRAGLPSWTPQRWAVLRLLVANTSPALRGRLDPLIQQLSLKVARMNDPQGVARLADAAREAIAGAVSQLERREWNDREVRALIGAIASDEAFMSQADVHTAEQVALSLQALAAALTRRDPTLMRGGLMEAIDNL
ncbi:MAG TPA: multiheme c-type cytochrome, partial [Thermoanaerobaculia bacterium]|nr:multiheme c-type cytochrome [Thermoanaerobaculia bacterium]